MGARRPRLVALRALGLGDLLTAVPALRGLARAFPAHERTLAAPAALGPLATLTGAVAAVTDVGALEPLPADLHGADVAVNLHGRGPQSHRVLLAARPRRLIAFAGPGAPAGAPPWHADEHEVVRWCRMLAAHGIPADPADLELPAPGRPPPPGASGATLIHPGAGSGARRWPVERFAAVARAEVDVGRPVVVTGGPGEVALASGVAEAAGLPSGAVLAGAGDLLDLAAAVAAAGRVLCGDTGVAHLATALGTPSVVLFGPTSPSHWGPPPDRERHRALWAGRRGDPHACRPDPGLLEIGVDAVRAAVASLPSAVTTSRA